MFSNIAGICLRILIEAGLLVTSQLIIYYLMFDIVDSILLQIDLLVKIKTSSLAAAIQF
jgi:hypothetical protein